MSRLFVYDENIITMKELATVLKADWNGFENLRSEILKRGKFFGNNDEISNDCADGFAKCLNAYFKDKKTNLGYKYLLGNLIGYNQHNKWFGNETKAGWNAKKAFPAYEQGRCEPSYQ